MILFDFDIMIAKILPRKKAEALEAMGDVPRILGFDFFQELPSVLLDDLPSSHRGFARRQGCDVQLLRYRNRVHP